MRLTRRQRHLKCCCVWRPTVLRKRILLTFADSTDSSSQRSGLLYDSDSTMPFSRPQRAATRHDTELASDGSQCERVSCLPSHALFLHFKHFNRRHFRSSTRLHGQPGRTDIHRVSKNAPPHPFYILNNSAKNEPILRIFGAQNPQAISHKKL